MERSRVLMLALLCSAPAAGAAPHRKGATPNPPPPKATPAPSSHDTIPAQQDESPATAPHNEGEYGGVAPDHPARPPAHPKPKHMPSKGTLSWVGFEAKDGGAELFFQSVAPFDIAQHVENGTLVVELAGLSRLGQNTWRPIDARFFETPIARVVAAHVGAARASKNGPGHGAGVEIRVSFKKGSDAHEGTLRTATEADGMYYAYLSFAGTGAAAGGTVSDPEK